MAATPTDTGAPRNYSAAQIALHWIIAVLILLQYLFADAMEDAWRAWRNGNAEAGSTGSTLHVVFGVTVLLLAAIRLGIRLTRGAPPLPPDHPVAVRVLAYLTHYALYAFLFLMPISGALAWFGGIGQAAFVHVIAKNFLLAFVGLHVLGAVVEFVYFRSPTARQMATAGVAR